MPPRFTYWTIILDGQPTAFRAAERDQLLPTLKQLQSRNPGAVLKWFAHGRVWESPEEMWQLQARLRAEAREKAQADQRGRGWRPGGQHKDPREKFKRETFQARKRRDKKAAAVARGFVPADKRGPFVPRASGPADKRGPSVPRSFVPADKRGPSAPRSFVPADKRGPSAAPVGAPARRFRGHADARQGKGGKPANRPPRKPR